MIQLFIALLIPFCSGYINDFFINVTFPGIEGEDNTRLFVLDTFDKDEFIWHTDEYSKRVGAEKTYDERKSKTYYDLRRKFEFKYTDENNRYCYLEGDAALDDLELLPYLSANAEFGIIKNATCGSGAIKRSTSFNGKLRAGKISFRQTPMYGPQIRTVGHLLANKFRNKQLCLHISVSEDMKIKQTVVAVGAEYNQTRHITHGYMDKGVSWELPTTYFKVGQYRYNAGYRNMAVFKSTYDKVKLPWRFFDYIVKESKAKYDNASGKYLVDCRQQLNLELGIEEGEFKIPFHALLRQRNPNDSKCELLLEHWNYRNTYAWDLGLPFFVNNGVCFHFTHKISFYNATYDENNPIFPDTFGTYMSVVNE